MSMMKKPKKPAFDASSLPKSKGITARPAKTRDASPNFVKRAQDDKTGTNPSNPNVPRIFYQPYMKGTPKQSIEYQKVSNKGKMRDAECNEGDRGKCLPSSMPSGKKMTKAGPKKAMASSSSKMASSKKPMMKTTKK
jgi:hypothetical protein